jgi:hypothetical protein
MGLTACPSWAARIAARLHRPVSTVRRWLRGARGEHTEWLYRRGVQRAAPEPRAAGDPDASVQVDIRFKSTSECRSSRQCADQPGIEPMKPRFCIVISNEAFVCKNQ